MMTSGGLLKRCVLGDVHGVQYNVVFNRRAGYKGNDGYVVSGSYHVQNTSPSSACATHPLQFRRLRENRRGCRCKGYPHSGQAEQGPDCKGFPRRLCAVGILLQVCLSGRLAPIKCLYQHRARDSHLADRYALFSCSGPPDHRPQKIPSSLLSFSIY
jgi:hypothetical protein